MHLNWGKLLKCYLKGKAGRKWANGLKSSEDLRLWKNMCMYINIIVFKDHFLQNPLVNQSNLSRIVRKPDYCLCENKGADQLRSNCEADQRLCFRYTDSTIPLLLKSEISSF